MGLIITDGLGGSALRRENSALSGKAGAHFLRAHNLCKYLPKGRHIGDLNLCRFNCFTVVRKVARCTGVVRQMTGKAKVKGGTGGGIHAHVGHHARYGDVHDVLRLEQAKQLLETTRMSLDSITYKIGYEDSNSFRRLFQQRVGLLPAAYRKKFQVRAG